MKTIINGLSKFMLLAVLVLPMVTSCYDDGALWNRIDEIENKLDSLENSLNKQFQALNTLIEGKTTVSSCDKKSDNSYEITLSDGTKFTVPSGSRKSLVTITEVNGIKCWATYNADGTPEPVTDPSGSPVPVSKEDYRTEVEVVVEDGAYYLKIDGKKYMTGYDTEDLVQVFTSCERLTDASGNVYAMKFTFGEGLEITVAVDGYNGVKFRLPSATGSILTEYYVDYGMTQTIQLEMAGVVDYVMQIPDGWRVKERNDEYTGENYLDITAPAAATVAAGAAVSEGDLKIVAVVEGGKAAVSKLALSTEPFKTFNVSGVKAVVDPYNGVQKYIYGLTIAEQFDEAALLEDITKTLTTTGAEPEGYTVTEKGINLEHSAILGKELDAKTAYVFWALPALYREGENAGFYVKSGMFRTFRLAPISVKFGECTTSLFDAEINVSVDGTKKMWAGTALVSENVYEDIIYQINNGIIEPCDATLSYKGTASAFPSKEANEYVDFMPETTYVTWVVPVEENKTSYTVNDIIRKEFTTNKITSGGSLKVNLGNAEVSQTAISFPVSSEGAELIYYAYFDTDRYLNTDNETKVELIMENETCVSVKGSQTTAKATRIKPNTQMWIMAVAVDKTGKYGEVVSGTAKTAQLSFNSIKATATASAITATSATLKVEITSGETASEYLYWFGKENDTFWKSASYLGATAKSAQTYMASNPDDENIVKSMSTYGSIKADGTLNVSGLSMNTNYVFIVLVKDDKGNYSPAAYKMVTTLAVDLGDIVRTGTSEWKNAKDKIQITWIEEQFERAANSNMPASYALDFKCPTNLTAYVICSTEEYYTNLEYFLTPEDAMLDIEKTSSRRYDSSIYLTDENGDMLCEPNWYTDEGAEIQGTLMNVCDFYVHGVPSRGFATYFAAGSHGADNCISWENGQCSNYARAEKMIKDRCSYDYWYNYFKENRYVTKDAYLKINAEAYLEAYSKIYKDATPVLNVNDGSALRITNRDAMGPDDSGVVIDDVVVVLKDLNGNYYEPMYFPVPAEPFNK